jgi:hypothetical protein
MIFRQDPGHDDAGNDHHSGAEISAASADSAKQKGRLGSRVHGLGTGERNLEDQQELQLLNAAIFFQVGLGIATLLLFVPVPLAALHQSGALLTLSSALWLSHELKFMKIVKTIPK